MSAQHTPGPLHALLVDGETHGHAIRDTCGRVVAVATRLSREFDFEGAANATLFAAAPELLAVLQEMIAHRDNLKLCDYPVITQARAALAKATGGGCGANSAGPLSSAT